MATKWYIRSLDPGSYVGILGGKQGRRERERERERAERDRARGINGETNREISGDRKRGTDSERERGGDIGKQNLHRGLLSFASDRQSNRGQV